MASAQRRKGGGVMKTIQVTDHAAQAINDMREDKHGIERMEKDNLINALADCNAFLKLAKDEEELQPWVGAIDNIVSVMLDYWRIRRFVEDTHD